MTAIETLAPFFLLALLIGALTVLILCTRTERHLAARCRVRLAEYREKNYLFYIGRDIATQ